MWLGQLPQSCGCSDRLSLTAIFSTPSKVPEQLPLLPGHCYTTVLESCSERDGCYLSMAGDTKLDWMGYCSCTEWHFLCKILICCTYYILESSSIIWNEWDMDAICSTGMNRYNSNEDNEAMIVCTSLEFGCLASPIQKFTLSYQNAVRSGIFFLL